MADVHVVVFVSQRNSFRSVLARACLEHVGKGRFKAYSCGNPSRLASEPHDLALHAIRTAGIPLRQDKQHDWNEFARLGAMKAQFVITLDATVQDLTPKWSGQPDTALWAYPDLVGDATGTVDLQRAASVMLLSLRRRLEILSSLPMTHGDRTALRHDVRDLGYLE
ncbi:protein tyrosine phosphatase [Acidovorax sp. LjRoot66]|uniref:protein tyrosine phosphatase n=1 Tax=Acidovorax sp. LjRoot66 TaxID=3342334 RepID=UPI003ED14733